MATTFNPHNHYVWHPCSQMKDYETLAPLRIASAKASCLITEDGRKIIDAVGSWWCKHLGHCHPRLQAALFNQAQKFEHTLLAGTTFLLIEKLSEKLCHIAGKNHFSKVFYASDGSSAVEIALKMALQYQLQCGFSQKNQIAYLSGAYHGENLLSLAVSDLSLYAAPFAGLIQPKIKLPQHPLSNGPSNANWQSFSNEHWNKIEQILQKNANTLAAIIVEPIVQGAGGMKIYSPKLLQKLRTWCDANGALLIADEIMTGFCRTGTMLACQHADVLPDITTVMKGLSGGVFPISAVLATSNIFNAFYSSYESGKAFMHSNTHCGNALGVAVAYEAIKIFEEENFCQIAKKSTSKLMNVFHSANKNLGILKNIRGIGMLAAADIVYKGMAKRTGYEVYKLALQEGVLLRPLGNTLYLCPPLIITNDEIEKISYALQKTLQKLVAQTTYE